ncbi:hypothetical protein KUV49_08720 [Roseovarius atlanticus]|nr:hypothetical protein [Roseovarius atlanticus]
MAGAAIAGAFAAWVGLGSWKREKRWQRDVELGEDLLVLMFQRRDAVANIRVSVYSYDPITTDEEGREFTNRSEGEFQGLLKYYQEKVDRLEVLRSEIYGKRLRASVVWGEKINELLHKLFEQEQQLIVNIQRYLRTSNPRLPDPQRDAAAHRVDYDILFDDEEELDEFKQEYDRRFEPIENLLRSKLKA